MVLLDDVVVLFVGLVVCRVVDFCVVYLDEVIIEKWCFVLVMDVLCLIDCFWNKVDFSCWFGCELFVDVDLIVIGVFDLLYVFGLVL